MIGSKIRVLICVSGIALLGYVNIFSNFRRLQHYEPNIRHSSSVSQLKENEQNFPANVSLEEGIIEELKANRKHMEALNTMNANMSFNIYDLQRKSAQQITEQKAELENPSYQSKTGENTSSNSHNSKQNAKPNMFEGVLQPNITMEASTNLDETISTSQMSSIESHTNTKGILDDSNIGLIRLRGTGDRTLNTSILVKNVSEMNQKSEDRGNGAKITPVSHPKLHNTSRTLPLLSDSSTLPQLFTAPQNSTQGGGGFSSSKNDTELYSSIPPQEHPFAGAWFANGSWGLVADVFAPRRTMINRFETEMKAKKAITSIFSYRPLEQGEELHNAHNGTCNFQPEAWSLLTDHIKVSNAQSILPQNKNGPKILCAVYTHDKNRARIQGILETWGWRCDGFFAASTKTIQVPNEEGYGMIDLPHQGPEEYGNMWQKSRSLWGYIYKNYLHDFDYFYVAGDDTHLIVENLHLFLSQINATADETPLYIGARVHRKWFDFAIGGGGYLLNRKALQIFFKNNNNCHMNSKISAEDRIMGKCSKIAGVHLNHTVDEKGRQLFFHGAPQQHATFNHTLPQGNKYFKIMYAHYDKVYGHKTGIDIVSNQAIAFHHVKGKANMKKHHAALYNKKCFPVDKYGRAVISSTDHKD